MVVIHIVADQDNVEALMSLMAANEMKSMGKVEKALKLIEHGIALAPKNPDLLNSYGELIETLQNDIVTADQMYYKVCQFMLFLCIFKILELFNLSFKIFTLGTYT